MIAVSIVAHHMYLFAMILTHSSFWAFHSNVNRLVMHTNYIDLDQSDVVAQISKVAFDASTFEIWGALLNGACLNIIDEDTLDEIEVLEEESEGLDAKERKKLNKKIIKLIKRSLASSDDEEAFQDEEQEDSESQDLNKLATAAIDCWDAILEKNSVKFGEAFRKSFEAQIAMFPNMAGKEIFEIIDQYRDRALGWKLSGAGGGGYLILVSDEPIDGAVQIKIRRQDSV